MNGYANFIKLEYLEWINNSFTLAYVPTKLYCNAATVISTEIAKDDIHFKTKYTNRKCLNTKIGFKSTELDMYPCYKSNFDFGLNNNSIEAFLLFSVAYGIINNMALKIKSIYRIFII
ncbi:hypothetical protein AN639_09460 [Candidatus Epulonipiscium fishelsonii]|uniref:Uncharacterized protein n=1 Tax=Candidatus Epulonipiscium fishelsonii TaxID=77094 RepID=A0ACC8XE95_9FIRM|nr:hypothetical protein AN639_09460 [Epulopiscium sp. SCG-B05WGA-EpuloA1]ONI41417.1 hypothetical protein AN396_03610 [Epulopiscium sp. SCG-B11WGA-EpuloA1]